RGHSPALGHTADVGTAVAGDVGHEAWMPVASRGDRLTPRVDPPALEVAERVGQGALRRPEGAVAEGDRGVYPVIGETHDVGSTVAGDVGHEAWMPVNPPTLLG